MRTRRQNSWSLLALGLGLAGVLGAASQARAALPEPDHLFYGVVRLGDLTLTDATVSLRSDDCASTNPAGEVGRYADVCGPTDRPRPHSSTRRFAKIQAIPMLSP